jgi:hypothetical protein
MVQNFRRENVSLLILVPCPLGPTPKATNVSTFLYNFLEVEYKLEKLYSCIYIFPSLISIPVEACHTAVNLTY